MKLFTVANISQETYGHGDFGAEQVIRRQGSYGSGEFPPLFKTKALAEAWVSGQKYLGETYVVELEVL